MPRMMQTTRIVQNEAYAVENEDDKSLILLINTYLRSTRLDFLIEFNV